MHLYYRGAFPLLEVASLSNINHSDATSLFEIIKGILFNIAITAPPKRRAQTTTHSRNISDFVSAQQKNSTYIFLGNCLSPEAGILPTEISEMFTRIPECPGEQLIDRIATLTPAPELLLVDIDALGDTTDAVDILTRLRLSQPQLILIILSAHFLVDDIDQHRITICDAGLRVPFTRKRFDTALAFARDTNKVWRKRVANTKGSKIPSSDCQNTLSFQS